jgi:hypothetical protein
VTSPTNTPIATRAAAQDIVGRAATIRVRAVITVAGGSRWSLFRFSTCAGTDCGFIEPRSTWGESRAAGRFDERGGPARGETDGGGGALGRTNWRVGGSSSIARGGRDDASFGIGTGVTGAGGRELNVIPLRGRSVVISSSAAEREKTRGRADGGGGNEL